MEIFAFDGFAFWAIILFVGCYDQFAAALDDRWYGGAWVMTSLTIIYVIVLVHATLADKLMLLSVSVICYACIGAVWAFKKWVDLVKYKKAEAIKCFGNEWQQRSTRPKPSCYETRIMSWIMFWPWSVLWWLLTWPRHVAVWVYDQISAKFDEISIRMWK